MKTPNNVHLQNPDYLRQPGSFKNCQLISGQYSSLLFIYVGYQSIERRSNESMNISLVQGENALSEVVVVGYGSRLKKRCDICYY
jgi:hypothetical protein